MIWNRPPLLRLLGALLLGLVIGLIGTFTHRSVEPWGLVLAFATLLAGSLFTRAWADNSGVMVLGVGWLIAAQALALTGPGGDVVVPAELVGYLWIYGGIVFVVLAAFAPRSWFSDTEFVGKE